MALMSEPFCSAALAASLENDTLEYVEYPFIKFIASRYSAVKKLNRNNPINAHVYPNEKKLECNPKLAHSAIAIVLVVDSSLLRAASST